jgi:hypothetical protein
MKEVIKTKYKEKTKNKNRKLKQTKKVPFGTKLIVYTQSLILNPMMSSIRISLHPWFCMDNLSSNYEIMV